MTRENIIYSPRTLAKELKISPRAVFKAIREGKLPTAKISAATFRIEGADVDQWLASLKKS